jgi:hypothetical protein
MNVETAVFPFRRLSIKQGSWLILGLLALAIVFAPLPVRTAVPVITYCLFTTIGLLWLLIG